MPVPAIPVSEAVGTPSNSTQVSKVKAPGIWREGLRPASTKSLIPSNFKADGSQIVFSPFHPLKPSVGREKLFKVPLFPLLLMSNHVIEVVESFAKVLSLSKFTASKFNIVPLLLEELPLEEELDDDELLLELEEEELLELDDDEELEDDANSQVICSDEHIFSSSQHFGTPSMQIGAFIASIPIQVGINP